MSSCVATYTVFWQLYSRSKPPPRAGVEETTTAEAEAEEAEAEQEETTDDEDQGAQDGLSALL
jgi:hypothetical protein